MTLTVDPFEFLTAEECAEIAAAGRLCPRLKSGPMKYFDGEDYVAPNIRRSSIAFMEREELGPVAEKLVDKIVFLNDRLWHADIVEADTQFQFAQYDGTKGEFLNWHQDDPLWLEGWRGKKIAMCTQLNSPHEYEGGVLEIRGREPTPRGLGVTVAFPGFMEHRVTPVTAGWRYAMVTWARGPHWR